MPIIKSAKKAARQAVKRTEHNEQIKKDHDECQQMHFDVAKKLEDSLSQNSDYQNTVFQQKLQIEKLQTEKTFIQQQVDIGQILASLWIYQGLIGLIVVGLCCRFAYVYVQLSGLWGILLSCAVVSAGVFWHNPLFIFSGFVLLSILGRLCWSPFLSMLPQLLALGHGRRLRWCRQVIVQPLAVLFVGATVILVSFFEQAVFLLVMTF